MVRTWLLTVLRASTRPWAISWLEAPCSNKRSTSSSRALNASRSADVGSSLGDDLSQKLAAPLPPHGVEREQTQPARCPDTGLVPVRAAGKEAVPSELLRPRSDECSPRVRPAAQQEQARYVPLALAGASGRPGPARPSFR